MHPRDDLDYEHVFDSLSRAAEVELDRLQVQAAVAKFGIRASFRCSWGKPRGGSSPLSRILGSAYVARSDVAKLDELVGSKR